MSVADSASTGVVCSHCPFSSSGWVWRFQRRTVLGRWMPHPLLPDLKQELLVLPLRWQRGLYFSFAGRSPSPSACIRQVLAPWPGSLDFAYLEAQHCSCLLCWLPPLNTGLLFGGLRPSVAWKARLPRCGFHVQEYRLSDHCSSWISQTEGLQARTRSLPGPLRSWSSPWWRDAHVLWK